jgi:hypothetical protein
MLTDMLEYHQKIGARKDNFLLYVNSGLKKRIFILTKSAEQVLKDLSTSDLSKR